MVLYEVSGTNTEQNCRQHTTHIMSELDGTIESESMTQLQQSRLEGSRRVQHVRRVAGSSREGGQMGRSAGHLKMHSP